MKIRRINKPPQTCNVFGFKLSSPFRKYFQLPFEGCQNNLTSDLPLGFTFGFWGVGKSLSDQAVNINVLLKNTGEKLYVTIVDSNDNYGFAQNYKRTNQNNALKLQPLFFDEGMEPKMLTEYQMGSMNARYLIYSITMSHAEINDTLLAAFMLDNLLNNHLKTRLDVARRAKLNLMHYELVRTSDMIIPGNDPTSFLIVGTGGLVKEFRIKNNINKESSNGR